MANWVTTVVEVPGIGTDFESKKFDISGDYNCIDVEKIDNDSLKIESKWRPPLVTLSNLSKQYPGQDMTVSYVNEGDFFIQKQLRLRDGQITGQRARSNIDERVKWADFNTVRAEESKSLIDEVRNLDKREQRGLKAEALLDGVQMTFDGEYLEM